MRLYLYEKESEMNNKSFKVQVISSIKMKVLLINGSSNSKGCTYKTLTEVTNQLEKQGSKSLFYMYNII